jgi:hypothetical protein
MTDPGVSRSSAGTAELERSGSGPGYLIHPDKLWPAEAPHRTASPDNSAQVVGDPDCVPPAAARSQQPCCGGAREDLEYHETSGTDEILKGGEGATGSNPGTPDFEGTSSRAASFNGFTYQVTGSTTLNAFDGASPSSPPSPPTCPRPGWLRVPQLPPRHLRRPPSPRLPAGECERDDADAVMRG